MSENGPLTFVYGQLAGMRSPGPLSSYRTMAGAKIGAYDMGRSGAGSEHFQPPVATPRAR